MPFTEKTKLLAKQKSAFRCCICHKPFVEIHHILPQAEGGTDELSNAAPLCASCHDLYGGNPEKRKAIRQMRDYWWDLIEKRSKSITESQNFDDFYEIKIDNNFQSALYTKSIALYHTVFEEENFESSAYYIHKLVLNAQNDYPNRNRYLFVDINNHKNDSGGFDHDMYELQRYFILGFLFPYLTKIYIPLGKFINKKIQENDVPEMLEIAETLDQKSIVEVIDKGISSIWVSDRDKHLKIQ